MQKRKHQYIVTITYDKPVAEDAGLIDVRELLSVNADNRGIIKMSVLRKIVKQEGFK